MRECWLGSRWDFQTHPSAPLRRNSYPKPIIVCGEQRCEDDRLDTLLNPTLIAEVLSDTTERFNMVKKFDLYRASLPAGICSF